MINLMLEEIQKPHIHKKNKKIINSDRNKLIVEVEREKNIRFTMKMVVLSIPRYLF